MARSSTDIILNSKVKENIYGKIVVRGGDNRLVGSVTIEGAKNAVLPLLAATILASEGKTVFKKMFLSYRMSLP